MIKSLSSLIKENSEIKKYKYTAQVTVEGDVTSMSESDAGEEIDALLADIPNVTDFKIISMDEVENIEIVENGLNTMDQDDVAAEAFLSIVAFIKEQTKDMAPYYQAMVYTRLGIDQSILED